MAEDRRVRKNRNALRVALQELMRIKPFTEITVSEVCEHADVNRSTFYYHYSSTEELLYELHESFFHKMDDMLRLPNGIRAPLDNLPELTGLLEEAAQRKNEFYFLMTHNEKKLLEQHMQRYYEKKMLGSNISTLARYHFLYHSIACATVIQQWFLDHCPCSAKDLASLIYDLSIKGWPYIEISGDDAKESDSMNFIS